MNNLEYIKYLNEKKKITFPHSTYSKYGSNFEKWQKEMFFSIKWMFLKLAIICNYLIFN